MALPVAGARKVADFFVHEILLRHGAPRRESGPGKAFRSADDARDSAGAANEPSDNNSVPSTGKWPGGTAKLYLRRHAVDVCERGPLGLGLGTAVRPVHL